MCVCVCVCEEKCSIYELTSAKLAFNVLFAMVLIGSSYQLLYVGALRSGTPKENISLLV